MSSDAAGETVALGLGSNARQAERHLLSALRSLETIVRVTHVASLYRTAPVSPIPQPDYLNTALLARSPLEPDELLAVAKLLERAAGRRRGPRYGPRPLDVDLLLWGSRERRDPELTLPHPRLRERAFFLAPLSEIAPELAVPPDGRRVDALLAELGTGGIERLAGPEWRVATPSGHRGRGTSGPDSGPRRRRGP
jgi:2-amino-4-hydroxy-6-hydroxymethyldihydropteridine diphosphokinase